MSVARITELKSSSKKSFQDAIEAGVARASKTLKNVQGAWVKDMQVECGMQSREVSDDGRQQVGCNRRDHADPQPAFEPVPRRARDVGQFIDRAQDVADALGQSFAQLGQGDLSGASLEQHTAESLLQLLDLHRQGWLRDRTCFRRTSEVAMTCQGVKISKLPKCNMIHQYILSN